MIELVYVYEFRLLTDKDNLRWNYAIDIPYKYSRKLYIHRLEYKSNMYTY